MIALLHFPTMFEAPDAIVWEEAGEIRWHTGEGARPSSIMLGRSIIDKISVNPQHPPWEDVFIQLSERNPNPAVWSIVETDDPVRYLASVRRAAR